MYVLVLVFTCTQVQDQTENDRDTDVAKSIHLKAVSLVTTYKKSIGVVFEQTSERYSDECKVELWRLFVTSTPLKVFPTLFTASFFREIGNFVPLSQFAPITLLEDYVVTVLCILRRVHAIHSAHMSHNGLTISSFVVQAGMRQAPQLIDIGDMMAVDISIPHRGMLYKSAHALFHLRQRVGEERGRK